MYINTYYINGVRFENKENDTETAMIKLKENISIDHLL